MKVKLDANEFKRIIDNTKRFIGYEESGNLMSWIHLRIDKEKNTIRAEAIDGHRASIEYASIDEADESFDCYIKPNIPKIKKSDLFVDLELSNERLYVQVKDSIIGYVQPKGTYYKIHEVIDETLKKEKALTIGVNARYLKEAMASIGTNYYGKNTAKITLYGPKEPIIIRTESRGGEDNIKLILPVRLG